jgi:hypothetical protein
MTARKQVFLKSHSSLTVPYGTIICDSDGVTGDRISHQDEQYCFNTFFNLWIILVRYNSKNFFLGFLNFELRFYCISFPLISPKHLHHPLSWFFENVMFTTLFSFHTHYRKGQKCVCLKNLCIWVLMGDFMQPCLYVPHLTHKVLSLPKVNLPNIH